MKELAIVFATDMKYIRQTCVAIESILSSAADDKVFHQLYILMPSAEVDAAQLYFENIQKRYRSCAVQCIGIGDALDNAYIRMDHITIPTYYRLLLPELVERDKCIYLDSDIIVCQDLSELYETDMEGYEAGGVLAPAYVRRKGYAERIGIPDTDGYINAGVLLLNLVQMRQDQFTRKALALVEQPFPAQDQDIINRVAFHKIKKLPYKYNVQVARKRYLDMLPDEEREEAEKNPVILHYSSSEKPWECMDIDYAGRWWKVCRRTDFFQSLIDEQRDSMLYHSIIKNYDLWKMKKYSPEWLEELKTFQKCYVYGAGKVGRRAVSYLKEKHVPITGILVSDLEGNDSCIDGVRVSAFTEDMEKDVLILVAVSEELQIQIRRKLFHAGLFYVMPFYELYYGLC